MNKVSHVIFDLDGLLLDTEPIYEAAVRQICKRYGKEYPREVRLKVLGTTEQLTIQIIIKELKLPISEAEFERQYEIICRQRLTELTLMKGGYGLIHHLHRSKIPFCLATSSSQKMAELKMNSHKAVFELFNHKVFGSSDPEVKQGKPAPDIFLIAAKRFPTMPSPSECIVFEDSPNGIKAATAAGMQSVMVPDKMVLPEFRKQATVVLQSLADFKPEMFGLPPYDEVTEAISVPGEMVQPEHCKYTSLASESFEELKTEFRDILKGGLITDEIVQPDEFKSEMFNMPSAVAVMQ